MRSVTYPPNTAKYAKATFFVVIALIAAGLSACSTASNTGPLYTNASTVAGISREFGEPFGIAVKGDEIFVSDGEKNVIYRILPDGSHNVFATSFDTPSAIAFDKDGLLIVADTGSHTIKAVNDKGEVSVVAGSDGIAGFRDGAASEALFSGPIGVAVGDNGAIYVADTYNDRIRVIENGSVRTLAGSSRGFADGQAAMFDTPLGIATWAEGRLLVADSGNRRIRVIESDGSVWTLAGNGSGYLKDEVPALAQFVSPTAVAVDEQGVIVVADGNSIRSIGGGLFPFVRTLSADRRGLRDGNAEFSRFNRPSGIAFSANGDLLITDSDNGLVRMLTARTDAKAITADEIAKLRYSAEEFRAMQPGRWPFAPADRPREIAGTLGEIRGEIKEDDAEAWFHNGLDIPNGYGETARFVRAEKVLDPDAVQNFDTLRELIRMPAIGYVHIRIGRDASGKTYDDSRFLFDTANGKLSDIRVRRGTRFAAGEPVGTLNAMNHVHLIAGKPGAEMNALDALILPGISDSIAPIIENVRLFDADRVEMETKNAEGRIILDKKARVVAKAYDRKDGNAERRRLAPYKLGYALLKDGETVEKPERWNISFEKMPTGLAVPYVYGVGSHSGATGETIFNFIVTNRVLGDAFYEEMLDPATLESGKYTLRVFAADFFGNVGFRDTAVSIP